MSALDVLICTLERPKHVLDVVRDVRAQLGPQDALLVLDQSHRVEPTRDALRAMADARITHRAAPRRGLPAARNLALKLTQRPFVLFLDDDVSLGPTCLQAHRRALQEPGIGATVGAIEERGMSWNATRTMNRVGADGRVRVCLEGRDALDVQSVKGCNMGFRREALHASGPFDEGLGGTAFLEETDMSERVRRAGWRIRFLPDADLIHFSAPTGGVRVGSTLRTSWWRFHNTGRFIARHRVAQLPLVVPTFTAIAARRAVEHGRPGLTARLMTAFWQGFRSGMRT